MTSQPDHSKVSVGFIGGGMMAEAIIQGILSKGEIKPSQISVSEPMEPRRKYLSTNLDIHTTSETSQMLDRSSIIFIAVKPHVVPLILPSLTEFENNNKSKKSSNIYVSICAGVPIDAFLTGNESRKVVRVMPNQPCLVGEAASAICVSKSCDITDTAVVTMLLKACGVVVELPESLLDAVTGVSGSGPAFVFMLIEAMTDAGVKNGLPRPIAKQLAAQTVLGSAKMVLESPDVHTAELRNRVESPGGTTIAGTSTLEAHNFRAAVISAVTAAKDRAVELGKQ